MVTLLAALLVFVGTCHDMYNEKRQSEHIGYDQAQRNKEIGQNKNNSLKISTVEKLKFYVNHNVEGMFAVRSYRKSCNKYEVLTIIIIKY